MFEVQVSNGGAEPMGATHLAIRVRRRGNDGGKRKIGHDGSNDHGNGGSVCLDSVMRKSADNLKSKSRPRTQSRTPRARRDRPSPHSGPQR